MHRFKLRQTVAFADAQLFRNAASASITTKATQQTKQIDNDVKPFAEMPGPCGPLGLGSIFNYVPVLGKINKQEYNLPSLIQFDSRFIQLGATSPCRSGQISHLWQCCP